MKRPEAWDARALTCAVLLLALAAGVGVVAMGQGSFSLTPAQVMRALGGEGPERAQLVVSDWRLPRVIAALVFGAALAMSGAVLQSLTRNPLGSPDVIGFDTGAYTGALVARLLIGGTFGQIATGALMGGVLTAALVYGLSVLGGGGVNRLIVIGIAAGAFLSSANVWLVLRAEPEEAMTATRWALGSLNHVVWERLLPAMVVIVVLGLAVIVLTHQLRALEYGDDLARAWGVGPISLRLAATLLSVGLAATVTAAAGPIAFVALAAPQVASRLTGRRWFDPISAACVGAALLVCADLAARLLIRDLSLPVGSVTISVGGAYLAWLVLLEGRRRARGSLGGNVA